VTYARKAAKSGLWFAGLKFATQLFSWITTIAVARILVPGDFGLITMATIFTGYIELFGEMGIGAAIVQKHGVSEEEISSIFWFAMAVGVMFTVVGYLLAYPTAWLFHDKRIVLITQVVSALFILSALTIVPNNILVRDLRFKELGFIQLTVITLQSLAMVWMAQRGYGVWTLVIGTFIYRLMNIFLIFLVSRWRPSLHYNFREVKALLKFGVTVSLARSSYYVFEKSDKFIVGKMFNAQFLGYYSFAMQLASIPNDKFVSIVNQVAFPVFSRYQSDPAQCRNIYLKITKYVAMAVVPIFVGGIFLGDQLIPLLLGEQWRPITLLFKCFCFIFLITALTEINNCYHMAQGRPHWGLYLTLANLMILPPALYLSARYGFSKLVIPWICLYPLIRFSWTWITLKTLQIHAYEYFKNIIMPISASFLMIVCIRGAQILFGGVVIEINHSKEMLVFQICVGILAYSVYLLSLERKSLTSLRNILKT
jgi:teichuronic acid exporter